MKFYKLALKNIKRSFKDYAIYFLTLVLGVAIFYVFNALSSQAVLLDIEANMLEIVELMSAILSGVSVFVAIVLGFLIIYASRFLIKRRNSEFGIYLTLGMSKRKIAQLLLIETFFVGVLSLVAGLALGVIVSQFTSALVAGMFAADLSAYRFSFSLEACLQTLLFFGVIYLVVMFFNTISISRKNLLTLLNGAKIGEKVRVKSIWISLGILVVACTLLGWAYWKVTGDVARLDADTILPVFIAGGLGTLGFFWSMSGLLLKVLQKCTKLYYKKLNCFTVRQFSNKINTATASLTVICLMLFVTILIFSSAISIRNNLAMSTIEALPVDIEWVEPFDTEKTTSELLAMEGVSLDEMLEKQFTYTAYQADLMLSEVLGEKVFQEYTGATLLAYDTSVKMMKASDYAKVAELYHQESYELAEDEYVILANFAPMVEIYERALANGSEIKIGNTTLHAKYNKAQPADYRINSMSNTNDGIFIIPDSVQLPKDVHEVVFGAGVYKAGVDVKAINKKILEAEKLLTRYAYMEDEDEPARAYYLYITTKQEILDNSIGISVLVTFVALYLGLIFLVASSAILALKELSESSDNRQKFAVLRKLGTSEKMLNQALFRQIAIFFIFPLAIAVIHAIPGMIFCNYALEAFGGIQILDAMIGTGALIVGLYGGYFLVTYFCSKNIIRERRI